MKRIMTLFALSGMALGMNGGGAGKFLLTSQSFKDGGALPVEYTKAVGGENDSPQLSWSKVPPGTKSFVICCVDIHPIARRWIHWLVVDIPATVSSIDRDASGGNMPAGAKELSNTFGTPGWGGPKPPFRTGVHKYVFTIYALNTAALPPLKGRLSEAMLLRLLKGKVLAQASITGTYEQK
ncbi:MAG: YbhB/YbcL family Raf kinase inhibitor-like protein [Victivallaceae bacterium]|nr:YbhB/YbcL family Raf kinase inhibitor-like protein [Victivallaceae bacterium]